MNNSPLVSICCVTYNHAPFIRQCLDGFLMQKTNFQIEILIHDDCSTDGTTEIVREYAAKYPDLIFPLYETENQFCKPGRESMDFYNFRRARGKYIATCEGDDYWTDPLKLQKQVDFMESHPEYSVCFTGFTNHVVQTDEYLDSKTNALLAAIGDTDGMDIDTKRYFSGWYTQQLTMMFRKDCFSFEWSKHYTCYLDTMEMYHLLKVGKGRLLNFNGGIYNIHGSGISSSMSNHTRSWENLRDGYEMLLVFHDEETRNFYFKSIFYAFDLSNSAKEHIAIYQQVWKQTPSIALLVMFKQIKRNIKKCFKRI